MSILRGQSKAEPSPSIASEFNKQFNGATNVNWEKIGTLTYVNFHFEQNLIVAYFDGDFSLIGKALKVRAE